MSRRGFTIILLFLTAINVIVLAINVSPTAQAAVTRFGYRELLNDHDFRRAVKSIVEGCRVNVDVGRVECR
jgi:hypothetical protein